MARELYKLKARETNRRSIVVVDGVCVYERVCVAISISPSVEEAQEIARTKLQTTTTTNDEEPKPPNQNSTIDQSIARCRVGRSSRERARVIDRSMQRCEGQRGAEQIPPERDFLRRTIGHAIVSLVEGLIRLCRGTLRSSLFSLRCCLVPPFYRPIDLSLKDKDQNQGMCSIDCMNGTMRECRIQATQTLTRIELPVALSLARSPTPTTTMPKVRSEKRTRVRHNPIFEQLDDPELDDEMEREAEAEIEAEAIADEDRGAGRSVWSRIEDPKPEERTCACDTLAYIMQSDPRTVAVCSISIYRDLSIYLSLYIVNFQRFYASRLVSALHWLTYMLLVIAGSSN